MKNVFALITAFALVLSLAACSGNTGSTAESSAGVKTTSASDTQTGGTAKIGGVLNVGSCADVANVAAWRLRSSQDKMHWSPVYEPLFKLDNNGTVTPFLAESLKSDYNTLTYTVTLRKGILFSDGSELTADVMLWNFENFKKNSQTANTHFGDVKSFEKTGDYTVVIHLNQWNSQIQYSLCSVAGLMYSKKAFDTNGNEWCLKNPVGTGPFILDKWVTDKNKSFVKNKNYWNKETKIYLDGINIKVVPNETTAQAALSNGELDVYQEATYNLINTMKDQGFSRAESSLWYATNFLVFASGVKDSPMSNLKVRQAISYAIDSESISKKLDNGLSFVSKEYAVKDTPFYNDDVQGYGYDVEKAKQLLKEAGYPNGFSTTIYTGSDVGLDNYMVAIQGYLEEIGIKAKLEYKDVNIWSSKTIYNIDDGMIFCCHGFGSNIVNQAVSNFSKRAVQGVGMLKDSMIHPDDLDQVLMNSLRAKNLEEMISYEKEAQKMIIDKYCLAYPVITDSYTWEIVSPKVVDTNCFKTTNEFNDFSKIYFKQ